jgi:hypothetical protein
MKLIAQPNQVLKLTKHDDSNSTSQCALMLSWRLMNYKGMLMFMPLHLRHYANGYQMTSYEQNNLLVMLTI